LGLLLVLDDGGDAAVLVQQGVEFERAGAVPVPDADDPHEYKVLLETLRESLAADSKRFTTIAEGIKGVTEETTTGVHRLYEMARSVELLFAANNVNDQVTKREFVYIYCSRKQIAIIIYV